MMKRIILLVSLLLAALTVLAGCNNVTPPSDETDTATEPVAPLTLFADGKTNFTVVRGDKAGNEVVQAAVQLRDALKDVSGVSFTLYDEYGYKDNGGGAKIAVGDITDEVAARLKSQLRYDDYLVHAEGGNLYLLGGSEKATAKAVSYFISKLIPGLLNENKTALKVEGDTDLRYTHQYPARELTVAGEAITSYRIVYDADLEFSRVRAGEVRDLIVRLSGAVLEVVPDTEAETGLEILVGVTNRSESGTIAAGFDSPNLYWSATVAGKRMVLVNGGVRSGEAMLKAVTAQLEKVTAAGKDINSGNFALSGDVKSMLDQNAFARQENTDLRVMTSNILRDTNLTENEFMKYSNFQRCELLADTYLCYLPDVILLQEMMNGKSMTPVLRSLLSGVYEFAEADYLGLFPDPANPDDNLKNRKYAMPVAYRKGSGIQVLESGFTYLSDMVSYHGTSWSAMETKDGNRFLAVSVHLSENKTDKGAWMDTYMRDVMKAIDVARAKYGDLPVIMGGDFFFWSGVTPYLYTVSQGFADASQTALKKFSYGLGTFHTLGKGEQDRAHEDLIFVNDWFEVLSHKILIDLYTVNGSDHYPVMADLHFAKSAIRENIPEFDDGTGNVEIRDEGTGGSGSWDAGTRQEG